MWQMIKQYLIKLEHLAIAPASRILEVRLILTSSWYVLNWEISYHFGDSFTNSLAKSALGSGGRLNKKDGLTRYGDSHVKDKTS